MCKTVEQLTIDNVMELDESSELLIKYNQETIDLYKRDKKNLARIDEFRIYEQIIKHIASMIRDNFLNKNVIYVCGFLSYFLLGEKHLFYDKGQEFKYDDDSVIWRKINELNYRLRNRGDDESFLNNSYIVQEIEKLENMTIESEEIYSLLGATVITGRGCCRHLSNFFKDVLVELGYYAYTITNSVDDGISCNDKESVCDYNHLCVLINFRGTYLLFDPTNIDISTISSYRAFSTRTKHNYILSPISLMRNNQISYSKMKVIYNVMSMQHNNVTSEAKEKYIRELSLGVSLAHEVLPSLSDDLEKLHNLIDEYMEHFVRRNQIILDYNYEEIKKKLV